MNAAIGAFVQEVLDIWAKSIWWHYLKYINNLQWPDSPFSKTGCYVSDAFRMSFKYFPV